MVSSQRYTKVSHLVGGLVQTLNQGMSDIRRLLRIHKCDFTVTIVITTIFNVNLGKMVSSVLVLYLFW